MPAASSREFAALLKSVWVSQGITGGRGSEKGATPSDVASSRASATPPLRFGLPGDATPAGADGLDMAGSGAPGQELTGARIRRMWC